MTRLPYYAHVDGLRAIAVLFVILFHYDLGVSGGYVGVDVFFVISGFLITSLLVRDEEFRLREFWVRRARRILPALFLVLAATSFAAWFLFLPADFRTLGESLIAQLAFVQNVVFWRASGYFSEPSESNPLLHTWSLAVEEQFYLGLPLLLLACRRWKTAGLRLAFFGLAFLSFWLGVVGLRYFPSAAFYLLPSRAWELLLGGLVALMPVPALSVPVREIGSALGLTMIVSSGFLFEETTPFPGWAALLPVAGTAAFILVNGDKPTLCAKVISWKPIVFVGLISYSLYLWHWPLLVFFKTWALEEMAVGEKVGLAVLAVVLAVLSWHFVEQPVRRRQILISPKSLVWFAGGCFAALLIFGGIAVLTNGVPGRMSPSLLRYAAGAQDAAFINELEVSDVRSGRLVAFGKAAGGPPDMVVWGDSLAMAVLPGIDAFCRENYLSGTAATHSATAPLEGFHSSGPYALQEASIPFSQGVLDYVKSTKPRHVILAAAWSEYLGQSGEADFPARRKLFSTALQRTVKLLHDSGSVVWIVTEPPLHGHRIPRILARRELFGVAPGPLIATEVQYRERQAEFREVLAEALPDFGGLIDLEVPLRDGEGSYLTESEGFPLYRDHFHLSTRGANFVRGCFVPLLRR